jgi:hypothetical protein
MRIYVPSTNLLYIEELLKEGYKKSDEKSIMNPTRSIRPNARKGKKRIDYVVLFKN